MESRRYYNSLTRNMVLIMILVSFTPLVLITGIIGYRFETSYRDKVLAHLRELVQKHQQNINMFLEEKLLYLQVLANSFSFEQLSDEAFLQQKLAILRQVYGGVFVDLGVIDNQGRQVAYAGPFELLKADYSGSDWFKRAIKTHGFISDVFLGLRNQPHFIVAVKQKRGENQYLVRATIDFMAFNSLVESIRIGETGGAFILNREGAFQTRLRTEPAPQKEFFLNLLPRVALDSSALSPPTPAGEAPPLSALSDKPREVILNNDLVSGEGTYLGREFIYVMTPLKSGEWILAYQQDKADAFFKLRQARWLAIFIFTVGGFSILCAAFVLSKRMVQWIEGADREKEMMNEQVIEAGKLASLGELAAGIAHEINNPIAIMVEEAGWIEDLFSEEDLSSIKNHEEFMRALQQIRTQGERCKDITHKLLRCARRTDPAVDRLDLNDLLVDLVSVSEQRAKLSNVKIRKNFAPELPSLSASPSELQQVFLNLINNAIDAMEPHGGWLDITTRTDGKFVITDVTDTGHGIPKAILPRVFDPFFTTKPVGKGTGLGLSICLGIVEKMGGEISVNSASGIGTTFHVHLPLLKKV